jgi:hypothetical protein
MFLIHKTILPQQLEYVKFDDGETKHHIMNRVNWRVVYEDEERDWTYDLWELMTHIAISMDDDTELLIVPAKEVKWSPYNNGYFYY